MALRPLASLTDSEQRTLDSYRDRAGSEGDKSDLLSEMAKSLQPSTHSPLFYKKMLEIFQEIGLEAIEPLLGALKHEDRAVADAAVDSIVELSKTDQDQVLDALWRFLHGSELIEPVDRAIRAITEITSDPDSVFTRLIEAERILLWQKGSIIVYQYHKDFLVNLHRRWKNDSQTFLPMVLTALEHENWKVRYPVIHWLADKDKLESISIPEDWRGRILEALKSHFRNAQLDDFGQLYKMLHKPAFEAFRQMGGQAAVDDLLSDSKMNPTVLGILLLKDESKLVEEIWRASKGKESLLPLIMAPLEDSNRENRLAATNWLAAHVQEIPWDSCDEVARALEVRLRDDEDRDVRNSADQFLVQLKQRERARAQQARRWLEIIRWGDEDSQVEAIEKLVRMETRGALRTLINEWVQWIAWGNKALLVEVAAETMRSSPFAILPLVDQLSQGYETHPKLEEEIRSQLAEEAEEQDIPPPKLEMLVKDELESRILNVQRRIAKQLADMSDPRFFDKEKQEAYKAVQGELNRHALPFLARSLPGEEDSDIRENMAYVLGNVGGREAVDGLARAIVGEERKRSRRQKLLADYYLEPSKTRSEEVARILNGAVDEAKKTLRILQGLNVAVFAIGVVLLVVGVYIGIMTQDGATRVAGALVGVGGFAGVITQLIRDPLDRIQNAMANLVQLETAFTSFIWELNLNGTYIQSQYVAEGILTDDEIAETVNRIEGAMSLAMNMVATYTKEGNQRVVTRINKLSPAAGELGSTITIHGQHLQGDSSQKKEHTGLIAINHTPIQAKDVSWKGHEIRFRLPSEIPDLGENGGTVWISLFVDGMETNALPFHAVKKQG